MGFAGGMWPGPRLRCQSWNVNREEGHVPLVPVASREVVGSRGRDREGNRGTHSTGGKEGEGEVGGAQVGKRCWPVVLTCSFLLLP